MIKLKNHINIALGYFLIIALLGTLLRLFFVIDIDLNYRYIVHAHSHIALLGWIYTAITTLIYYCFIDSITISKKYRTLFWCTQFTLIGMLISFPITGYALFSIIFSTLFLLMSYWFFGFILKNTSPALKRKNSFKLIKTSLWFMVLSSIGPWALGGIMNTLGNASIWYKNAIYFYLHFQYNGWFIVALFGILFYVFEKRQIEIPKKEFNRFYWLLISSVLLTFFISVLWTKPPILIYVLSGAGSILQLIAFGYLYYLLKRHQEKLTAAFSPFVQGLFKMVVLLFILKMFMQTIGSFPYFATLIATQVSFAIGYLHWTFLGVVSIAILGLLHHFEMIYFSKKVYILYLVGFVLTESLIFYKGITQWLQGTVIENYYLYLAVGSFIFFIAITLLFLLQFRKVKTI